MRDHSTEGKYDVGYYNDGSWCHITRVSGEKHAHDTAQRLSDPSPDARELIGLTGNEDIKVKEA